MGKTGTQPCNAASRRAATVGHQTVTAPVHAARASHQAAQGIKNWLETRYGMDRKERMIVYGVALGAPLALLASPLVGIGLAGALAAPGLSEILKRRRQNPAAALAPIVQEGLAPVSAGAQEVMDTTSVQELQSKVAEQQAVIEALFSAYRQQQTQIDELVTGGPVKQAAPEPFSTPEPNDNQPSALFSFSSAEADKVLDGRQTSLIRNGRIKVSDGQRVVVYGKQPKKAVVGSVQVERIVTGRPEEVWEQVGEQLGGERSAFIRKCKKKMTANSKTVSIILLSEPQELPEPIKFQDSGLSSYDLGGICYLKPDENERHQKLLGIMPA
jgi:predicted transcriptional regulator